MPTINKQAAPKSCAKHLLRAPVGPLKLNVKSLRLFDKAGNWIDTGDAAMGRYRAACVRDGRLEAVFFIAPDQRLPEREWLASLFGQAVIDPADLAGLLAARPPQGSAANAGHTVCACFSVGEKTIRNAIRQQGLDSVETVGACLKAGTGCGSCVPEIGRILRGSA